MAEDQQKNAREGLSSPADNSIDIDPIKSDSVDLPFVIRGLHVNVGGLVRGIVAGDTVAQTYFVNAGGLYPYRFKRIFTSITTATGLKGMF